MILGAALLLGAAPAHAQRCGLAFVARLGAVPGVAVCSELTGTSSSASLLRLPGLASRPSAYDAFLDAIELIPPHDGLRGWATADAGATIVTPSLGGFSLLGQLGAFGLSRLGLPARSLDYFRSDTLGDSLYWSFDGVHGLGVVYRSVGGGALLRVADGLSIGATVGLLSAERLVGGRVSGGMLESFRGLDVDLRVDEYRAFHGSGVAFAFLASLARGPLWAALTVDHVGSSRLVVQSRIRAADSTYQSTREAIDALATTQTRSESVDVQFPARVRLGAVYEVGGRTALRLDSDIVLAPGYHGGDRVGAGVVLRPASWVQLEAGGGWGSGIDASLGVGISAGRFAWRLDGLTALNGRDVRLSTGLALH